MTTRDNVRSAPVPASYNAWFWDMLIVIFFFLGIGGIVLAFWTDSHAILYLSTICLALLLYGSFVEPKRIKVNKKSIHLEGFPTLNIAVIGDIHVGPYKKKAFVQKIVDRMQMESVDIILLVGDFLFDFRSDISDLDPLKNLHAPLGVYAIIGNHDSSNHILRHLFRPAEPISFQDRSDEVSAYLEARGIMMLRNRSKELTKEGKTFAVAGTDDVWMKTFDLAGTVNSVKAGVPSILMSHNPDIILQKLHTRFSLIVAGHTHGGQIRLPLIGALYPIPDELGRRYDRGVFTLPHNTILAVTHGIGETLARARLFCTPEILLLKNEGIEKTK